MLAATALALGACGGDEDPTPPTPAAQTSAASDAPPAGVSGKAAQSPAKLCAAFKRKARGKCVSAVKKAAAGENPARACKGHSRKKTKGVRGGTPFSLCVRAARKAAAQAQADEAGDDLAEDELGEDEGSVPGDDETGPADTASDNQDDKPGRGRGASDADEDEDSDEEPPADAEPSDPPAEDEDF